VSELPPCGIYRLRKPIQNIEAGRLVYFHNHGDPGPGVYLLRPEGFYRVTSTFHCCAKKCTKFETDTLVQLGYNGNAQALVFLPEVGNRGMNLPQRGSLVDDDQLKHLALLKVVQSKDQGPEISLPRGMIVH
jgi:hypothetical protein